MVLQAKGAISHSISIIAVPYIISCIQYIMIDFGFDLMQTRKVYLKRSEEGEGIINFKGSY